MGNENKELLVLRIRCAKKRDRKISMGSKTAPMTLSLATWMSSDPRDPMTWKTMPAEAMKTYPKRTPMYSLKIPQMPIIKTTDDQIPDRMKKCP
jgi:hypothetical protein